MSIAFISSAEQFDSTNNTNQSFTYTCPVNADLIVICINTFSASGDIVTGVTYNGVSATRADEQVSTLNGRTAYIYYLYAPATGANTLTATFSGNSTSYIAVLAYEGADSTPLDATNGGMSTGTTITSTITTTVDDTALVSMAHENRANTGGGTNTTVVYSGGGNWHVQRSTANISPAGATSLSHTVSSSEPGAAWVIASFKSAGGGGGPTPTSPLMMMGVGT